MSKIGPERLTALLPSDPGGEPALPADAEMTTTIDVFVTGRAYRTDVWFDHLRQQPIPLDTTTQGDPSLLVQSHHVNSVLSEIQSECHDW